ncbi:MAG: glycosyltransferase family 9 protein [Planctomycetes bacterium]|nr:glycosyltransferase family 9 protein [Planctomycetota bacterium]
MTSVLLVRLSAMGDLVHGLGAIEALHRARPDWRLTLATQTALAPLLEGVPGIARVVLLARHGGLGALRRFRAELRAERYDVALDLQGNWKSAGVAAASGARQRLGAGAAWRQEPRSRWLLHRTVAVPGEHHPALVAWTLARELVPGLPFRAPRLRATDAEVERERAALRGLGVDPDRPMRVLVVGDPVDARALRPAALAAEAAASQEPAVAVLGPAEAHVAAPGGVPALRHAPGELRRLVALGALVAGAGGIVVGPDQGATHVLAAAGARCLVGFGAQDPRRTAPPSAVPLVHPAPPACSPCRKHRCRLPEGPVCMAFTTAGGRAVANGLPPFG